MRMLEDGNGNFYDPNFYEVADDAGRDAGVSEHQHRHDEDLPPRLSRTCSTSRRRASTRPTASPRPPAVWDPANALTSNARPTSRSWTRRVTTSRSRGSAAAVAENAGSTFRWGLIRLRQNAPGVARRRRTATSRSTCPTRRRSIIQDTNSVQRERRRPATTPSIRPACPAANFAQAAAPAGTVVVAPAANTASAIATLAQPGAQRHAGADSRRHRRRRLCGSSADLRAGRRAGGGDRRDDGRYGGQSRAAATRSSCSSPAARTAATPPTPRSHNAATTAIDVHERHRRRRRPSACRSSSSRVKPAAADEASLQAIATNSGGVYRSASTAVRRSRPRSTTPCSRPSRVPPISTPAQSSEFTPVSPIVGTVNLKNAARRHRQRAAEYRHHREPWRPGPAAAQQLPADRRASRCPASTARCARSEPTSRSSTRTKPTGWKFVNDGTRLWPDLDGRPALAGMARTPLDPNTRNIYTYHSRRQRRRLGRRVHAGERRDARPAPRRRRRRRADHRRPGADDRRRHRVDARRSWTRRRSIRRPTTTTAFADCARARLPATLQGSARADLLRRQRRHDPRDRCADRLRGVGVHSLQPAAEAADAPRRPGGRAVRLLRRQLAEDRRSQDRRRRGAVLLHHRRRGRRHVLSGVRRDRSGHGRRSGRRRSVAR